MRKSTINSQLERPPTKKKNFVLHSGLGFFLFYGTYTIRKKPCTKSISAHCFFRHLFSYGNLTWEKWTKSSQK